MAPAPTEAAPVDIETAVVRFRRQLVARRVQAGPSRSAMAVQALRTLDELTREQVYWALRCTLVSRPEDVAAFDRAFAAFWGAGEPLQPGPRDDAAPEPGQERQAPGESGQRAAEERERIGASTGEEGDPEERDALETGAVASSWERLATLDFSAYRPEDLAAARRLMTRLTGALPRRRSRRLQASPSRGARLNLRRTVRESMRTEGDPLRRAWRERKQVPRRLVFLVDVSGSMREYALPILVFCQVVIRSGAAAEAFAFGTRLTRLTPHLRRGSATAALERVARLVPDWAGGTRIGDNVRAFNEEWARRGLSRGALVVIVSDGWERGPVDVLGRELSRLRRTSAALLWVNPLAGDPGYEPLAAGMAVALQHVDGFLPGHNFASLEELVARLAEVV